MFCPKCGNQCEDTTAFCPKCGKALQTNVFEDVSDSEGNRRKTVTAILCFFLGAFGAHRFYEGKTASGVTMLLLNLFFLIISVATWGFGAFLYGILGIWALIDFIIILTRPASSFTCEEDNY